MKGKTTSELAEQYMSDEARLAIEHNIFTPAIIFITASGMLRLITARFKSRVQGDY